MKTTRTKNARIARTRLVGAAAKQPVGERVQSALAWLKRRATKATLDGMARYAIPSHRAYGVAMKDIKALGATLGRDQALAAALWTTGIYEARMLASFVGDPQQLTPATMDRWCRDFDNWAFCDALSFNLFDRSPHAWTKVAEWSDRRNEFEKRTAFALLWSLSVHDKRAGNASFLRGLELIEREAGDGRNFVKKATNMALRAIGAQSRAQHRRRGYRPAPGTLGRCLGALGGSRRAARAHEPRRLKTDRMTPWIGYFETFQTNLLSGREFTTSDTASGQPVATVNESFARVHFAGADPVGRQFKRIRPNNKESEGIVVSRSRQPARGRALAALAAAVALGLASRRYRPVLPFVIAEYAGDTLWATAVFFVLRLIRPAASGIALAAVTLAIAYAVELSQLAHPRWLDALRQQPGVALILGYDFVTSDLACYTAGVMLAWAIDAVIRPRGPAAQSSS